MNVKQMMDQMCQFESRDKENNIRLIRHILDTFLQVQQLQLNLSQVYMWGFQPTENNYCYDYPVIQIVKIDKNGCFWQQFTYNNLNKKSKNAEGYQEFKVSDQCILTPIISHILNNQIGG